MKCAVIIPVGPGHEKLVLEAAASVDQAFKTDQGPFSELMTLRIPDPAGEHGRSRCRNQGIAYAAAHGAEWIFFLDADDLMLPVCFAALTPHVGEADAVFGLIAHAPYGSNEATIREKQLGPTDAFLDILRHDPAFTLQMGHFVRTNIAASIGFDEAMNSGEDFKYYLDLWFRHRCRKIGEPLFVNRRGTHSTGPRSADVGDWRVAVTAVFESFCAANDIKATFRFDGKDVRFAIANPLDLIQRHFLNGLFFEERELACLRDIVPPGAVILEIGANVGNHAVFYGLFMDPERIIAVEPNPAAIAVLKRNMELNGITNFDDTRLGCGVGEKAGRFTLHLPDASNLGAARLVAAETGEVPVFPIDDIVSERIDFLKIDVEWMELETLHGARRTIAESRPILFIEIMNDNVAPFMDWVRDHRYVVIEDFRYVNAHNFVVVPSESPLATAREATPANP